MRIQGNNPCRTLSSLPDTESAMNVGCRFYFTVYKYYYYKSGRVSVSANREENIDVYTYKQEFVSLFENP